MLKRDVNRFLGDEVMTEIEFRELLKRLRSVGKTDDDILIGIGRMFQEGKITRPQLEDLMDVMGYEMNEEVKDLTDDELKTVMFTNKE